MQKCIKCSSPLKILFRTEDGIVLYQCTKCFSLYYEAEEEFNPSLREEKKNVRLVNSFWKKWRWRKKCEI